MLAFIPYLAQNTAVSNYSLTELLSVNFNLFFIFFKFSSNKRQQLMCIFLSLLYRFFPHCELSQSLTANLCPAWRPEVLEVRLHEESFPCDRLENVSEN